MKILITLGTLFVYATTLTVTVQAGSKGMPSSFSGKASGSGR